MANVFKRGGKWYVRYLDPGGKDKRVSIPGVKTRREAELEMAKVIQNLADGSYLQRQRQVSFFEICDDFLVYSHAHKRSAFRDEVCIKKLKAFFGDVPAESIKRPDIERYMASRKQPSPILGRKASDATINREITCLKTLYKRAEQDEKISTNPSRLVKKLHEDNVRDHVLTDEEFQALLKESPKHHIPIIIMAWETGMRKSEILNLTWDHVDLSEGFITLDGSQTKTGRGRRVPISPVLNDLLRKMKRKGNHVFSYLGKPIMRYTCTSFKGSCKRAGIDDFRFHDLRHCFVTRMRRKGVPDRVIMQITGHTTMECFSRYDTISKDDLRVAVGALERVIENSWHKPGTKVDEGEKGAEGCSVST